VDAIKAYVRNGGIFLAKEVEDGKWLTTGDPLNYLKAVLEYSMDRDDLREPLIRYMQALIAPR
jgi:UTP-glucose-1-phosphate uridylyltransferase